MRIELDSRYSALIDQLSILTSKLHLFINGTADQVVSTDNGPMKTLAGLAAGMEKFQYVQKILNHRLHSDMINDALNIENGMLIRVWGDVEVVNGLYEKREDAFVKVNYSTLNDLLP